MYESLQEWVRFPILHIPFLKRDAAGDETYGKPEEVFCYRVDAVKEIRDKYNDTYYSSQQLYLQPNVRCNIKDLIAFPEAPDEHYEIHKIGAYYDGNEGCKSITVLYL